MTLAAICGLALAAGVVATRAHADEWDQRTIITVHQPIQVEQVVLDPGTYVLKLMNTQSGHRNVVQIYTADERHLVNTVFAIDAYRPRPTDDTQFTFWETPAGTARALRAWYYPGQLIGQEFFYPITHGNSVHGIRYGVHGVDCGAGAGAHGIGPDIHGFARRASGVVEHGTAGTGGEQPWKRRRMRRPRNRPQFRARGGARPDRGVRRINRPARRRICLRPPARFLWSD